MSLKRKLSDSLPFVKRVKLYRPSLKPSRSFSTPLKQELRIKPRSLSLKTIHESCKFLLNHSKEDGEIRRKIKELWEMRREDEISKVVREEESLRELRKTLVFHAQPIRRYSGLCIRRSEKKLTQPISPKIRTPGRRAGID